MAASSEEIRHRLTEFAAKWGGYQGSERGEAQTFLTQLLDCYGTSREEVGAEFEHATGGKFVDMVWLRVCLFEMKRPTEAGRLEEHREQALGYWRELGKPGAPTPPWVVLCAFHRFEVWKPGEVYNEPLAVFDLAELPENLDALLSWRVASPASSRATSSRALPSRWSPISTRLWTSGRPRKTMCSTTLCCRRCGRCSRRTWTCFRATCSPAWWMGWLRTQTDPASTTWGSSSGIWPNRRLAPITEPTRARPMRMAGSSPRRPRCTWRGRSWECSARRAISTGSGSSPRSLTRGVSGSRRLTTSRTPRRRSAT